MLRMLIMRKRAWLTLVLVTATCLQPVHLQSGPEAERNNEYFLDKHCNGPTFNIFDKEAVIKGHSSTPIQKSPETCTLTLATENNFERAIFRITVRSAKIEVKDVHLAIYDGTPGQPLIAGYDYLKGKGRSELFTTGKKVSFVLTRRNSENYQYSLEFVVSPIVSGIEPGPENGWGGDYGYFNRTVPNMVIYIIVGVLFLIVIVVIIIVAVVCHRKQKGLDKKPDQYKISYISQPPLSRVPASEASTRNWVSTSRNSLHRSRKQRNHSDDDSVFDGSVDSIPNKRHYDLDRSYENSSYRRNQRPQRHNSKPNYRNDSYVQADDDHPQDIYIQREMTPRVHSAQTFEPQEDKEDIEVGSEEEEESTEGEEETEEEEVEEVNAPEKRCLPIHPPPRLRQTTLSGSPQPAPRTFHQTHHPLANPGDPRNQMSVSAPYLVYPGQPPSQFLPLAPGTGQFQQHHGPTVSMPPPPQYLDKTQIQKSPNDPPIYSYLVQRGYNPLDGRESPASVNTKASGRSDTLLIQPEEANISRHNLDAGVEYMRR